MDEVERVADRVAILHEGEILLASSMDEIKETHRRFDPSISPAMTHPPSLIGAISFEGAGSEWTYRCSGEVGQLRRAAEAIGATVVDEEALTLDEIFL